jgi:hypothetical protein
MRESETGVVDLPRGKLGKTEKRSTSKVTLAGRSTVD